MTRHAISRRNRSIITIVCALAISALCLFDHSCTSRAITRPAQSLGPQTAGDFVKYDGKQFSVIKVVDGDTLDIDIPDANYKHTRIRLWGVDTPETKDPRIKEPMFFGKEASDFATKLAFGRQVTIYLDKDRNSRDKYRRLLAYIRLPDGTYLNEVLLSEGYAYADLRFKHTFYNKYKQLEAVARSQKKGLWQNVTRDQLPAWLQRERPDLLKKK